jgi:hypothetical protein
MSGSGAGRTFLHSVKLFSTPDTVFTTIKEDVTGSGSFISVDLHKCTVMLRAVSGNGEVLGHLTCSTKAIERIEKRITELPGPRWRKDRPVNDRSKLVEIHRGSLRRISTAERAAVHPPRQGDPPPHQMIARK